VTTVDKPDSLSKAEQAVIEQGCKWIDEHEEILFELLVTLVAQRSLTGAEGTHTDDSTVVGQLWDFLDGNLSSASLDAQRIPPDVDYCDSPRENLYTTLHGETDENALICTSHTDIVPAGKHSAWPSDDPFRVVNGRVRRTGDHTVEIDVGEEKYERTIREKMARVWDLRSQSEAEVLIGRGVYDNKASIVCLVGSLLGLEAAFTTTDRSLGGDLIHGHLVGEEVYQIGAKNMVGWRENEDWLGDRYPAETDMAGIVLEGSYGFVPVIGHRGLVWAALRAKGKSAHASTPELGQNAVVGTAEALQAMSTDEFAETLAEYFIDDALLGDLTIAPGTTIVGGGVESVDEKSGDVNRSGMNAIPDWCETTFDIRIPRWKGFPDGADQIQQQLENQIENKAAVSAPNISFTATIGENDFFPPAAIAEDMESARADPLVQTTAWATQDTFGYEPGLDIAPGVTDAAFLYHGTHMPTLVEYGPAGALSHEPLEYVERDHVIEGAKTMLKIAVRELGVSDYTS
jgi:acetylornithine deacetylase/succinyl-diaminopimelate desuccinylase-like protein